jgi:hypothetical protein
MDFHSYRLILERGSPTAEWLLEWDASRLVLRDPQNRVVFDAAASEAHRALDPYQLYAEGKISITGPYGAWVFKSNGAALAALRDFLEAGLAADAEYRSELRRQALRVMPLGLALFVVGGGLFGLYCWYASWAPDPPRGHWIRWFGWLIHLILLVLMAAGIAGPCMAWFGLRQWLRIRRIEQACDDRARDP